LGARILDLRSKKIVEHKLVRSRRPQERGHKKGVGETASYGESSAILDWAGEQHKKGVINAAR